MEFQGFIDKIVCNQKKSHLCLENVHPQSVSQKFPISAVRHKGPNVIRGKAPENFGYLTLKALESI